MAEKEFTLKYEFHDDVGNLNSSHSPEEEHFGVKWRINILKSGNLLHMWLYAYLNDNPTIHADCTPKIFSKIKGKTHSEFWSGVFRHSVHLFWCCSIDWETVKKEYLNDGRLKTEINLKIKNMRGFRQELRSFGEEIKHFCDAILKVEDRKFYVSKLSLSSQSPYFATLFLGQFQESEQSEIKLKDVNPQDFQYYLEVIYAEYGIDEHTVEGILQIAHMYDIQLSTRKCENFLVNASKLKLKKKLELAGKYRLEVLKEKCLGQNKTKWDIRAVVPKNAKEMDHDILAELFDKLLEFHCL